MTGPGHGDIHHPSLLSILKRFLLGGDQSKQGIIDDFGGKAGPTAVDIQQNDVICLQPLGRMNRLETDA